MNSALGSWKKPTNEILWIWSILLLNSITVTQKLTPGKCWTNRYGRMLFVDLAGSERLKKSKSCGEMLKETGSINRSLFTLGKVCLRVNFSYCLCSFVSCSSNNVPLHCQSKWQLCMKRGHKKGTELISWPLRFGHQLVANLLRGSLH